MARRVPTGVAVAVAVLIFVGVANAAPTAALTQAESSLLGAMNSVRQANGLQPLRADGRLEVAARSHSTEMLHTGTFAHGAFIARIRGTGVRTPRIGENLAWSSTGGITVAHSIVEMWLASPEHRANLLHPGYRLVGVGALRGCFDGRRNTLMVTTDFAGR